MLFLCAHALGELISFSVLGDVHLGYFQSDVTLSLLFEGAVLMGVLSESGNEWIQDSI